VESFWVGRFCADAGQRTNTLNKQQEADGEEEDPAGGGLKRRFRARVVEDAVDL